MKNAIIIHGWGANSQENWFPWLAEELRKKDFNVAVPDFPNSQYPILTEWLKHFKKNVNIDKNTILIGHSLGTPFILRFLEQLDEKIIDQAFFVAGFERSLNIPEVENFVNKPFNWTRIKNYCNKFFVINSDNDPYINLSIGKDLARNLNAKLIVEHNGDHLSNPLGNFSYPKLLELILSKRNMV